MLAQRGDKNNCNIEYNPERNKANEKGTVFFETCR
jgi:flagellar basal body rod protein FlgC